MTTHVPMTKQRVGNNQRLTVRLEETVYAEYDIGSSGDYVSVSEITGRLLVEPSFNRGELIEVFEKSDNVSIADKIRMLLDGWTYSSNDNKYQLDYGTLIFRGTDPLSLKDTIDVSLSYTSDDIKGSSPEELRNHMRTEITYESTYENIEANAEEYLANNGISVDQVKMGVPLHIQAQAESMAVENDTGRTETGVRFDITLDNKSNEAIRPSTMRVGMPPRISRGVKIDTHSDIQEGNYNPETEAYEFDIDRVPANDTRVVTFLITQKAKGELTELSGEVLFEKDTPFTNVELEGFYDAGGRKSNDEVVDIRSSGSFVTSFSAETSEIRVGDQREVQKNISVEGITPQQAMEEIGQKLRQRNIGANRESLKQAEKLADDSVEYSGGFVNGSAMQGETKVYLNIDVTGRRKLAQKQRGSSGMDTSETLPDVQRQTTTEYGQVGVSINATGNNLEKVDDYATELRKDIQLELEAVSEEI